MATSNSAKRLPACTAPRLTATRDDEPWSSRCEFWHDQAWSAETSSRRKRPIPPPLILSGHGVRLRVNAGALLVTNGFTHYPQEREEWRLFPGDWRLPSRIVVLDSNGSVTFDALQWLNEHEVPLIQINWRGEVVHVTSTAHSSLNDRLVEAQLRARNNERQCVAIARKLIAEKINASIATLRIAFPQSPPIERALQKLERDASDLKRRPPSSIGGLRGIEGRVGLAYFSAWRSFPIRWSGTGRRPIPEDWKRIGQRSSFASGRTRPNRYATHPVNAMLNYAYAVLETQVRSHVIGAGLDASIGFLHGKYELHHSALVFDLMEPLRPIVDRGVLDIIRQNTFIPADFTLGRGGICRLNPQLAGTVVRTVKDASETATLVSSLLAEISR
jgi:CRISP-associated protein Cas1